MGDSGDYSHKNTIDGCLLDLVGDVNGLVIYDLACGNGYMARRFVKEGAKEVWASDISERLIDFAKNKYNASGIKYFVRSADDFTDIPENHFDLITMHMALFYIEDLGKLFQNIHTSLKTDGRFVFTYDHPLRLLAYKVMGIDVDLETEYEEYLNEGLKKNFNNWTKKQDDLWIYRRPLGSIINALGRNKLLVKAMTEPKTKTMYMDKQFESAIPFKMGFEAVKVT